MRLSLRTKRILQLFQHKLCHIQDTGPLLACSNKNVLVILSTPSFSMFIMQKDNLAFQYQEIIFSTLQVERTGALLWAQSRDPQWSRDVWGKNRQSPENRGHRHRYLNQKLMSQPCVLSFVLNACIFEKVVVKLDVPVREVGFCADSGGHWLGRDRRLTRGTRQHTISALSQIYLLQGTTWDHRLNQGQWIRSRFAGEKAIWEIWYLAEFILAEKDVAPLYWPGSGGKEVSSADSALVQIYLLLVTKHWLYTPYTNIYMRICVTLKFTIYDTYLTVWEQWVKWWNVPLCSLLIWLCLYHVNNWKKRAHKE